MQYSRSHQSYNYHRAPVSRPFLLLVVTLSGPLAAASQQPPQADVPIPTRPFQTDAPHASTPSIPSLGCPSLDDVQDRLDTIDQTGLYTLLSRILNEPPGIHDITPASPHPLALLNHPEQYRCQLVFLNLFLHPEVTRVRLGRTVSPTDHIYYVPAQVPFEKNRRMPAILLLLESPENIPSAVTPVFAYFYMILRVPTRQSDPATGPTVLDYVVLVAQRLQTAQNVDPIDRSRHRDLSWLSGAILVILLAVWITLRRWAARRSPAETRGR